MSAAATVTIVATILTIVVIATFLLGIVRILSGVNSRFKQVVAAVSATADSTEPLGPAVSSINRDLGAARDVFESLLERKAAGATDSTPAEAVTRARAPGARDRASRTQTAQEVGRIARSGRSPRRGGS